VLKEGRWIKYGYWQKKITLIQQGSSGELFVGNDQFFGKMTYDSINDLSSEVREQLAFSKVKALVCVNSGNFAHVDRRILKIEDDILDYNYEDVVYAGKLSGELIIQRENQGLYIHAASRFRKINESEAHSGEVILDVLDLGKGSFLLLYQKTAVVYDGDSFAPWTAEGRRWIRSIDVSRAISNQEGIFLSDGSKIYHLDHEGVLRDEQEVEFSIQDIFADVSGRVWLAGNDNVTLLESNSAIELVHKDEGAGRSILHYNQNFLRGSNLGLYFSRVSARSEDYYTRRLLADPINALHQDGQDCIISHENGLSIYSNGYLRKIAEGYASNEVETLLDEEEGVLIEATGEGLNIYESKYGRWRFLNHLYGIEEAVVQIVKDEQGRLWARTKSGKVARLKYDQELKTINPKFYDLPSAKGNRLNGIFLINGRPMLCASLGVYEFNSNLDRFEVSKNFTRLFGESSNLLYLFQDSDESIWYISSQESGVLKVTDRGLEKSSKKISLPRLAGLVNSEDPYIAAIEGGPIVFGGREGYVKVKKEEVEKVGFTTTLYSLENMNKKGEIIETYFKLGKNRKELFSFTKKTRSAKLFFSTSLSTLDSIVRYSYNINDEGWSKPEKKNELDVNLQGGRNNVKVRAHYGVNEMSNTLVIPIVLGQEWFMEVENQYYIIAALAFFLALLFLLVRSIVQRKNKRINVLEGDLSANNEENKVLKEKNEILSAQLISALNENDISYQLNKLQKENADPDLKKAIKKLSKKLKSATPVPSASVEPDPDFIAKLKLNYPSLTKKDIKLCSLLKMDLSTKDIAPILDITVRGVEISRYRLRKKLELAKEVVLTEFLKEI